MPLPSTGLQLQSLVTPRNELQISLSPVAIPEPAADEVLIRVEAAPINPSDLNTMIGPADISQMRKEGGGNTSRICIPLSKAMMQDLAGRLGHPIPVGVEGAGTVVAAGVSAEAQALIGKVVAVSGGAMYAEYRLAKVSDLLVAEPDTSPAEAASSFVNPLTALGMVETLYREGHAGLVHTAAASNLGQMLNRVCIADNIPLVNVVRKEAQATLLRDLGARHVVISGNPSFQQDLLGAIEATNATLCFDAIGGGEMTSNILDAMEKAQKRKMPTFDRYGSTVHKQVYIYGLLDTGQTNLTRAYGSSWGVGGWLLPQFLARIGQTASGRLRRRVARELTTTFASKYARTISLFEALEPDTITAFYRRTTGEKYLIAPHASAL